MRLVLRCTYATTSRSLLVILQMKQTALHVAVELGNPDVISALLAAGTQLTLRDSVYTRCLLTDGLSLQLCRR